MATVVHEGSACKRCAEREDQFIQSLSEKKSLQSPRRSVEPKVITDAELVRLSLVEVLEVALNRKWCTQKQSESQKQQVKGLNLLRQKKLDLVDIHKHLGVLTDPQLMSQEEALSNR